MAEALYDRDRAFLCDEQADCRTAWFQDGCQRQFLIRFNSTNAALETRGRGILGCVRDISGALDIHRAMSQVCDEWATLRLGARALGSRNPDAEYMCQQTRNCLTDSVAVFCADAASDEQRAGRMCKSRCACRRNPVSAPASHAQRQKSCIHATCQKSMVMHS